MLHNQEVQINELQQQLKGSMDEVKADLPTSDFLTDVPAHSFHDEKKPEQADESSSEDKEPADTEKTTAPDEMQASSTVSKEKP
jgi:hypothetical protein